MCSRVLEVRHLYIFINFIIKLLRKMTTFYIIIIPLIHYSGWEEIFKTILLGQLTLKEIQGVKTIMLINLIFSEDFFWRCLDFCQRKKYIYSSSINSRVRYIFEVNHLMPMGLSSCPWSWLSHNFFMIDY